MKQFTKTQLDIISEALMFLIERREEDLTYFSKDDDCYQDMVDDIKDAESVLKDMEGME